MDVTLNQYIFGYDVMISRHNTVKFKPTHVVYLSIIT